MEEYEITSKTCALISVSENETEIIEIGKKFIVKREIIIFPTSSPRLKDCSWISLKNIKKYEETELGSIIQFTDDNKMNLSISLESLENQIFRATQLMLISRKRSQMKK